jgi:hypothetical protein
MSSSGLSTPTSNCHNEMTRVFRRTPWPPRACRLVLQGREPENTITILALAPSVIVTPARARVTMPDVGSDAHLLSLEAK